MIINRPDLLEKLMKYKDKDIVKIITGMRRAGKSVLLKNLYKEYLLKNNIPEDHIIIVSLDLKKYINLRDADTLYDFISSRIIDDNKYYIFIDEIQFVKGFEEVVNSLKSEFNTDIYITGSNSKLLSKDINTVFRGRGIEIKVFPLSFKEFYDYIKGDKTEAFNEYIRFGGMPFLTQEDDEEAKTNYLKMILDTVVTRDIIERYNIRNETMFLAIVNLLFSSIGSYVSANKIANTLKSNGFKTANNETVSNYLKYLCDSFLFYPVYRYDIKGREYLNFQVKYYCSDIGLRNVALNYRQIEMTHIIENIVYLELLRRGYNVDIGKNIEKEVDFIASKHNGERYYIQVSYTIEDSKTREREISAFKGIDDGYKKIVITMDNNPFKFLENGYLHLNLFDFLLDFSALQTI